MARADDFINLIAEYLEDMDMENVFTAKQPDAPDDSVAIFGLVGTTLGQPRDVPELQFPRFQVIARATEYETASTLIQTVREHLHGLIGKNLPHQVNTATTPYVRVLRCHADQDGQPIGQDSRGRFEFSINFTAEYHYVDTED